MTWDDVSGTPNRDTVRALQTPGAAPGETTGADLLAAALELDEQHVAAVDIARVLAVPLDVVRGWLRDP